MARSGEGRKEEGSWKGRGGKAELVRGDFRFQRGQAFPDLNGRGELVVQSPVLDFDARQSFPQIADARGDGFLEDLLDCFEG